MRIDTTNIPDAEGKKQSLDRDGDTQAIVRHILKMDKENDRRFCAFAAQFERSPEGLRKLFVFVRDKITYREDENGVQLIKTPAALWNLRVGDCKSKTLFVNQVLRCMRIPYTIRFVSYKRNHPFVTHVYSIADLDGEKIPMDTVYGSFGKEKTPYYHQQDYTMTHIMKISGVGRTEPDLDICKKLLEMKQKQSYIPKQEFIQFSRTTTGFARLMVFKQNLLIKKAMIPEQEKLFQAAINLVDSQLKNPREFHASSCIAGVGSIPTELQPVARAINAFKTMSYPAMRMHRPRPLQPSNGAAIRGWNQDGSYTTTTPPIKTYKFAQNPTQDKTCTLTWLQGNDIEIPGLFMAQGGKYAYARNSQYAKTFDSPTKDAEGNNSTFVKEIFKIIKQFRNTPFRDGNTVIQKCATNPLTQQQICVPMTPLAAYFKSGNYSTQFSNADFDSIIQNGIYSTQYQNVRNGAMVFNHNDYRSDFMAAVRMASGIMDEYMNDTFKQEDGIGNGFIYGYALDARKANGQSIGLNDLPGAVLAKYGVHAGYLNGATNFSGLDYNLIKALGTNTIAFHNDGKNPDQLISELWAANKQLQNAHAVGMDPATIIGAIVALIVAIVNAVIAVMQITKQRAESIEPGNVPDEFQPIGLPLQLAESDWDGAGGSGTGDEEGEGSGMDMGTLLLLTGGGLLGYEYLFNKK